MRISILIHNSFFFLYEVRASVGSFTAVSVCPYVCARVYFCVCLLFCCCCCSVCSYVWVCVFLFCLLFCCSVCSYVCVCVFLCLSVALSPCVYFCVCLLFCPRVCISVSVYSAWWFAFVCLFYQLVCISMSDSSWKNEPADPTCPSLLVCTPMCGWVYVRATSNGSATYDPRAPGNGSQISSVGRRYWAFSPRLPHWPTHPAATSALLDDTKKYRCINRAVNDPERADGNLENRFLASHTMLVGT